MGVLGIAMIDSPKNFFISNNAHNTRINFNLHVLIYGVIRKRTALYQFPLLDDDHGSYDPLKSNIVIVPTKPPRPCE